MKEYLLEFLEWLEEQDYSICQYRGPDPNGWSNRWDEWIASGDSPEDWIRKFEESRAKNKGNDNAS